MAVIDVTDVPCCTTSTFCSTTLSGIYDIGPGLLTVGCESATHEEAVGESPLTAPPSPESETTRLQL